MSTNKRLPVLPPQVYVGFQEHLILPASCKERLVAWYLGTECVSAFIAIESKCTRDVQCLLCNERKTYSSHYGPPGSGTHIIAYLPTRDEGVKRLIDYVFPSGMYRFFAIQSSAVDFANLTGFLQRQHGKPWNGRGFYCNFLCRMRFGCVSGNMGVVTMTQKRWFCTELATAALQSQGLLLDMVPCQTTPGLLRERLEQEWNASPNTLIENVYSDLNTKQKAPRLGPQVPLHKGKKPRIATAEVPVLIRVAEEDEEEEQ